MLTGTKYFRSFVPLINTNSFVLFCQAIIEYIFDFNFCTGFNTPGRKRRGKNQNDPARFIKSTAITQAGEVAGKNIYKLALERITKEEKYDGFYAVITKLEGDVGKVLKINRQRWGTEENFRIMKTDFEARPVYVRRKDLIKAHFLTCYISLLEKKRKQTYLQ